MRCDVSLRVAIVVLATFILLAQSDRNAGAQEPVQQSCYKGPIIVKIVGRKSDLIEIWSEKDKRSTLLLGDYAEMRGSQGPPQPGGGLLGCNQIKTSPNIVVVRAGWRRDIIHAYGLIRSSGGQITGVQRAIVRFRDGATFPEIDGDDVLVTFGRKQDLRTRLCFGNRPGASNPPYGATEWGWFYGTPRTGNFPACMGRLNDGASGRANWGQKYFAVGTKD